MVDGELFIQAKNIMLGKMQGEKGIGTMSEKSVHAVLKYYYAPDEAYHEVPIGRYVADTCVDGEIHEIQTRQFYRMNDKLSYFLDEGMEVNIVYPVSVENTIIWIDPTTGVVEKSRTTKTPKKIYKVFRELYGIRDLLENEHLHLKMALLKTEDYRLLDGYGPTKKKRATKTDKMPTEFKDEIVFEQLKDAAKLLPEELPEEFTVKDFEKATGLAKNDGSVGLLLLYRLGELDRRKEGHGFIYRRIKRK